MFPCVTVFPILSVSCQSKMTPGMYWPQHIARLRDTTLLCDEDEHCSDEEEGDLRNGWKAWFMVKFTQASINLRICWAVQKTISQLVSKTWAEDDEEETGRRRLGLHPSQSVRGGGAMFMAPSRPNVAGESIPLSPVSASSRHPPYRSRCIDG